MTQHDPTRDPERHADFHAEQFRYRRPAVRDARCRRHVGRRRIPPSRRRCWPMPATMSSASRCSFTIMARRPTARVPVAPAAMFMTPARSPSASAFRITCSTTKAASRKRSSTASPRAMWRARRRYRASSAISRSSFATCSAPRATSAPKFWRPDTMSPRGRCPAAAARCTARARPSATRATFCSPPRPPSSISCAFRSAIAPRRKPANWRAVSACRSPKRRTARTSVSCRAAIMPT